MSQAELEVTDRLQVEKFGNLSHHTETDRAASEAGRARKMVLVRGLWPPKGVWQGWGEADMCFHPEGGAGCLDVGWYRICHTY